MSDILPEAVTETTAPESGKSGRTKASRAPKTPKKVTKTLSAKQQMIFDYLKEEVRQKGFPPTVREICDAVGLSSTSTVHAHLETLERKGYIRRSPTKNRATEILHNDFYAALRNVAHIPVVGDVAAGVPILADENIEDVFPVPMNLVKDDVCFMLRVKGESMIEKGIHDGDMVLVRQQQTASNGDIVIALIDDSATVKQFYKESEQIRLQPANPAFSPLIVDECEILGKVISLYRKM